MCGIAGILDRGREVPAAHIEAFTRSLAHRGPDGEGFWRKPDHGIALGHRRLAILDPTPAGHQPVLLGGRYAMTYNGEVYNFLELRKELQGIGYDFVSDCDTEVILAAYDAWGPACLRRFNGMWAIAIYDLSTRSLWLARDRFGIKPLYYLGEDSGRFSFASETIAFRQLPGFTRRFDGERLRQTLEDVTALEGIGETIFEGIRQVRPGHELTVHADGKFEHTQWWHTDEEHADVPTDPREQVDRFRELFDASCTLRLRSDVPLASAVSGGLDSSSVYATVHALQREGARVERQPAKWSTAYVMSLPGSVRDETGYAREVVSHLGGELRLARTDPDDIDALIERTRLFDNVFHNPSTILHDLYGAMSADGVKVSLDGHGVDEMMFGYPFMAQAARQYAAQHDTGRWGTWDKCVSAMKSVEAPRRHDLRGRLGMISGHVRSALSSPAENPAAYHKILYDTFHVHTLPAILRNFDRCSMAVGVEIRMPFMDHRLVSYVFALHVDALVKAPYTKYILRQAMSGRLPEQIRLRTRKLGIMSPLDEHFAGPWRTFVSDIVNDRRFRENPHWDGEHVASKANEKLATGSWTLVDGLRLWPYLNAYLLQ